MNKFTLYGLSVSGALAFFISPLASSLPDGLERVAENLGFAELAGNIHTALLPDYIMPGISHEGLATGLAGLIGVFLVFFFMILLGKLLIKTSPSRN